MTRTALALALALPFALPLALAGAAANAADPKGAWLNEDQDGIVQIADCGGLLCGTVVWIKNPIDPATGRPVTDKKNTDAALRERPIMGLQVISAMKPSSTAGKWDGRIYSIDDGKTFNGNLVMKSDNEMRVQGCVLLICQGENWTRTAMPAATAPAQPGRAAPAPAPQRAR
jgi:uncharacterized protein (DUF2147 family)